MEPSVHVFIMRIMLLHAASPSTRRAHHGE
jgi:hypothetical protein